MSSTIPALSPVAHEPIKTPPRPASPQAADSSPRLAERHPAPTLTPADVGYVDGLMGFAPAQTMEYIMLKTGIPMPANLGQDVDTAV